MTTMLPATVVIVYNVPSANQRDKWHWRKRHRDTKYAEALVIHAAHGLPRATGPRSCHVMSYRRQRITDSANLSAGAKGLVDSLVRTGLLVDDKDSLARITYDQAVMSKMPPELARLWQRRPLTVITIADQATTP